MFRHSGAPARIKSEMLFVVQIVALAAFFTISFLGFSNNQNHGGDYAQYLIHSKNLIELNNYGAGLEGYPAVLPGYPLLLIPLVLVFGLNFFVIAVLNSLAWGFAYFRLATAETLKNSVVTQTILIFALFSPTAIAWNQSATPHIIFGAVMGLMLSEYVRLRDNPPNKMRSMRLYFLAFLGSFLRPEYAVVGIVFALFPGLRRLNRFVLAISSLVPIILTEIILTLSNVRSYGESASRGFSKYLTGNVLDFPIDLAIELNRIGFQLTLMFFGAFEPADVPKIIIGTITLGLLVFSVYKKHPYGAIVLVLVSFYGLWAVGVSGTGSGVNRHYLISSVFPMALAFGAIRKNMPYQKLVLVPILVLALINVLTFPSPSYQNLRKEFYYNSSFSSSMEAVSNYPDLNCIGFYKPRPAKLWLASNNVNFEVFGLRSIDQASTLLNEGCAIVIGSGAGYGQKEILDWAIAQSDMLLEESGSYLIVRENTSVNS